MWHLLSFLNTPLSTATFCNHSLHIHHTFMLGSPYVATSLPIFDCLKYLCKINEMKIWNNEEFGMKEGLSYKWKHSYWCMSPFSSFEWTLMTVGLGSLNILKLAYKEINHQGIIEDNCFHLECDYMNPTTLKWSNTFSFNVEWYGRSWSEILRCGGTKSVMMNEELYFTICCG